MGAIASGGVRVLNHDTVDMLGIDPAEIDRVAAEEEQELRRREEVYRGNRPRPDVEDHIAILVDDGLATGSTMKAAAEALHRLSPKRIVVAVPVASASTCDEFEHYIDEVVCATTPAPFYAVGMWYEDFSQTSDRDVQQLLEDAAHSRTIGTA